MKKHLLTAVFAIVAIGGVFARNANTKVLQDEVYYKPVLSNECTEVPLCTITNTGIACTAVVGPFYDNPDCQDTPVLAFERP